MIHAIAALTAIPFLTPDLQDPTAAEWGARLVGAERLQARQELIALGRKAAPVLGELVVSGDGPAAWQAVTLFGALGKDVKGAVRTLTKCLADGAAPDERRAFAALALGGVGDTAAIKPLARVIAERVGPELSVAVRIALGHLGKNAARSAADLMQGDDTIVRQWGAQVLYLLGPDAAGGTKAICAQLEEHGAYPLYATLKLALGRLGRSSKPAQKAWEERAEILPRQAGGWIMLPKVYDDNDVLMEWLRTKRAAGMENEDVPTHLIPPTAEMALPDRFTDFNLDGRATVGEVFMVWAAHIAVELEGLESKLYSPAPPAVIDDWRKLALRVEKSCSGLETLAPIRDKRKKGR